MPNSSDHIKDKFRNIFIVESRDHWGTIQHEYSPALDLVLTYDFALRKEIEAAGGRAFYVDHLCEQSQMQENNFLMYQFFREWHIDSNGKDIFHHNEVDFGFSFRIEIWNDFTFYVRSRLCLEELRCVDYERLVVCSEVKILREILNEMDLSYSTPQAVSQESVNNTGYFFPIHQWMNERLRVRRFRHVFRDWVITIQGIVMAWVDRLVGLVKLESYVFVQEYHPTIELIQNLQRVNGIKVLQENFTKRRGLNKFLTERPIPIYGGLGKYQAAADNLIDEFQNRRTARLVLSTGIDITSAVNRIIDKKLIEVLPEFLRSLDCVVRYLNHHPIRLVILIANIGRISTLVDCVAKSRNVPTYMIINGFLGQGFLDEGRYASVVNAYSVSIRDNYFSGSSNVVCLGDPRMDVYSRLPPKAINRINPTVTIGASGYSPVDLNSYLAVEFDFLFEVLTAITLLQVSIDRMRVILRVRSNGYVESYRHFLKEFFPSINVVFKETGPIYEVLQETDLYISIFSQTIIEASCLGIPAIYHKSDLYNIDPPFDGLSELVTTRNIQELVATIMDFINGSSRFDPFLEKDVIEKYIGKIDGKNLDRNFSFIKKYLANGVCL